VIFVCSCCYPCLSPPIASASLSPSGTWEHLWRDGDSFSDVIEFQPAVVPVVAVGVVSRQWKSHQRGLFACRLTGVIKSLTRSCCRALSRSRHPVSSLDGGRRWSDGRYARNGRAVLCRHGSCRPGAPTGSAALASWAPDCWAGQAPASWSPARRWRGAPRGPWRWGGVCSADAWGPRPAAVAADRASAAGGGEHSVDPPRPMARLNKSAPATLQALRRLIPAFAARPLSGTPSSRWRRIRGSRLIGVSRANGWLCLTPNRQLNNVVGLHS